MGRGSGQKIEFNSRELELLRGMLDSISAVSKTAGYYAIRRTLITVRKEAGMMIADKYHISSTSVRNKLKLSVSGGVGRLEGTENAGLSMVNFARTRKVPSTRKGKFPRGGVPVKIRKDKPKRAEPGAFIVKSNGAVQMFKRKGAGRYPIQKVIGPSPLQLLSADGFSGQLSDIINDKMEDNLLHIYRFRLSQRGINV